MEWNGGGMNEVVLDHKEEEGGGEEEEEEEEGFKNQSFSGAVCEEVFGDCGEKR